LLVFTSLSTVLYAAYWLQILPVVYGDFIILAHDTIFMTILAGLMAMEFGQTMHQRDHIKKNLRKFVDTQVADKVIDDQDILKPRKNNVTVMFCDIRSFTSICEMMSPEEVVEMLNGYLETMVHVIQAHGGVIDKFGGDSILAVWGVPSEQENHAMNAAVCAIAMRKELRLFNRHRESVNKIPISIGVALHSGPVIAGAIGAESRLDYTVIGDTVNTAARLESLTKEFGADTLISHSTWELIKDKAMASRVKEVKVKGKSQATMIYKLIGTFDLTAAFHCYDDTYQATLRPPYKPGIVENSDSNLIIYKYG
jgi:adenylate cyclase